MAVIVLQAQAADRVLATDVEAARHALAAIDSTGREGLAELRRMLDILVDLDPDDLEPRPSLDHLDLLVDRVRSAGLPVSVSVSGRPRPLPVGLDLSAYRIVQEALTNTLKHGGTDERRGGRHLPPGRRRAHDRGPGHRCRGSGCCDAGMPDTD